MKLFRFASVLASVSVGVLIQPVLAEVTAENIFHTISKPTDGHCDGKDIDTMVHEAITLNNKAIDAIKTLLKEGGVSYFGEEGRLAQIAAAQLGVTRSGDIGLLSGIKVFWDEDNTAKLKKFKENYEASNKKLLASSNTDNGKLTCGDKDWHYAGTWKALGYLDRPWALTAPVFISKHFSPKTAGQYDMGPDTVMTDAVVDGKNHGTDGLCSGKIQAVTVARKKLVTMCDSSFKQSTLADLLAQQDKWDSGKSIDDCNTVGADFHHEMFHYLNQGINDLKIDGKSAYGWANCVALADNDKKVDNAPQLKNADNYRMFALAVFLNRVNWGSHGKKP